MTVATLYYHGGPAGLAIGSYIEPPHKTRAPSLSEYGAAGVHRRDRVYCTTDPTQALPLHHVSDTALIDFEVRRDPRVIVLLLTGQLDDRNHVRSELAILHRITFLCAGTAEQT